MNQHNVNSNRWYDRITVIALAVLLAMIVESLFLLLLSVLTVHEIVNEDTARYVVWVCVVVSVAFAFTIVLKETDHCIVRSVIAVVAMIAISALVNAALFGSDFKSVVAGSACMILGALTSDFLVLKKGKGYAKTGKLYKNYIR